MFVFLEIYMVLKSLKRRQKLETEFFENQKTFHQPELEILSRLALQLTNSCGEVPMRLEYSRTPCSAAKLSKSFNATISFLKSGWLGCEALSKNS